MHISEKKHLYLACHSVCSSLQMHLAQESWNSGQHVVNVAVRQKFSCVAALHREMSVSSKQQLKPRRLL